MRQLHRGVASPGRRECSTATQVIAVVVFVAIVAIEFLLILISFTFLELLPEATNGTSR